MSLEIVKINYSPKVIATVHDTTSNTTYGIAKSMTMENHSNPNYGYYDLPEFKELFLDSKQGESQKSHINNAKENIGYYDLGIIESYSSRKYNLKKPLTSVSIPPIRRMYVRPTNKRIELSPLSKEYRLSMASMMIHPINSSSQHKSDEKNVFQNIAKGCSKFFSGISKYFKSK